MLKVTEAFFAKGSGYYKAGDLIGGVGEAAILKKYASKVEPYTPPAPVAPAKAEEPSESDTSTTEHGE